MKILLNILLGLPKSIYVNFKALPISQAIRLPILVSGKTKVSYINRRTLSILNPNIRFRMISIGIVSPNEGIIYPEKCFFGTDGTSKIVFRGKFQLAAGGG